MDAGVDSNMNLIRYEGICLHYTEWSFGGLS